MPATYGGLACGKIGGERKYGLRAVCSKHILWERGRLGRNMGSAKHVGGFSIPVPLRKMASLRTGFYSLEDHRMNTFVFKSLCFAAFAFLVGHGCSKDERMAAADQADATSIQIYYRDPGSYVVVGEIECEMQSEYKIARTAAKPVIHIFRAVPAGGEYKGVKPGRAYRYIEDRFQPIGAVDIQMSDIELGKHLGVIDIKFDPSKAKTADHSDELVMVFEGDKWRVKGIVTFKDNEMQSATTTGVRDLN